MEVKKTPLFEEHLRANARMVEFAGWNMPIQYKGLTDEHHAVRNQVGLFDVSHMGEVRVKGPQALRLLEYPTTNLVEKLEAGQAQYSLLPNETGGLVDDIIVYCLEKNADYLVCVNAANKDKDFSWISHHNTQSGIHADLEDQSSKWAQIAVQGPLALTLLDRVMSQNDFVKSPRTPAKFTNSLPSTLPSFHLLEGKWKGHAAIFASTGYTGEKGGEIFIAPEAAAELWQCLLKQGEDLSVQPIGLGARDTLRTEMKYSLYGHEIDDTTNAYGAGLGWVVKAQEKDFLGKPALLEGKTLSRKLVGFKTLDKGIPRQGYKLFSNDQVEIGWVTSGTHSPTLNEAIGIGYVPAELASEGSQFLLDVEGENLKFKPAKLHLLKNEVACA